MPVMTLWRRTRALGLVSSKVQCGFRYPTRGHAKNSLSKCQLSPVDLISSTIPSPLARIPSYTPNSANIILSHVANPVATVDMMRKCPSVRAEKHLCDTKIPENNNDQSISKSSTLPLMQLQDLNQTTTNVSQQVSCTNSIDNIPIFNSQIQFLQQLRTHDDISVNSLNTKPFMKFIDYSNPVVATNESQQPINLTTNADTIDQDSKAEGTINSKDNCKSSINKDVDCNNSIERGSKGSGAKYLSENIWERSNTNNTLQNKIVDAKVRIDNKETNVFNNEQCTTLITTSKSAQNEQSAYDTQIEPVNKIYYTGNSHTASNIVEGKVSVSPTVFNTNKTKTGHMSLSNNVSVKSICRNESWNSKSNVDSSDFYKEVCQKLENDEFHKEIQDSCESPMTNTITTYGKTLNNNNYDFKNSENDKSGDNAIKHEDTFVSDTNIFSSTTI